MFVIRLGIKEKGQGLGGFRLIEPPTRQDVADAIDGMVSGRLLHCAMHNDEEELSLEVESDGEGNSFALSIFNAEAEVFQLWNGQQPNESVVELSINGYPEHLCVDDPELVADVMQTFAHSGRRLERAGWKQLLL